MAYYENPCPGCGDSRGVYLFDRTLCACGRMHTICWFCGTKADACDDAEDACACGEPLVVCSCGDTRCPRCDPDDCEAA